MQKRIEPFQAREALFRLDQWTQAPVRFNAIDDVETLLRFIDQAARDAGDKGRCPQCGYLENCKND